MTETILERVQADTREAMKARERERVGALRMISNALQQEAKEGDGDEVAVLRRERKRRLEAAEAYREGGSAERAEAEEAEAEVISSYLPAELSDEELGGDRRRGDRRVGGRGTVRHGQGDGGRDAEGRRARRRQAGQRDGARDRLGYEGN